MVASRDVIPKVLVHSAEFATVGLEMNLNLDATSTTANSDSEQSLFHR